jgi:hypothetical protein
MAMLISVYVVPPATNPMHDAPAHPAEAKLLGIFDTPVLPVRGDVFTIIKEGDRPEEYRVLGRVFGAMPPKIITPDSNKKFTLNDISLIVEG